MTMLPEPIKKPLLGWTKDGVKTPEQLARIRASHVAAYRPLPTREDDPWFKGSLHLKQQRQD